MDSQVNAWDSSSFTSDRDDPWTVRGRQTPYSFREASEGEEGDDEGEEGGEGEEEGDEEEEEERGDTPRNHEHADKIDVLTAAFNNFVTVFNEERTRAAEERARAAEERARAAEERARAAEARDRSAREIGFLHHRLDLLEAHREQENERSAGEFAALYNRFDGHGAVLHEIIDIIQRMQRNADEHYARVERSEIEQMRERQLIVSLLSAVVATPHRR
ncbi:caldesmon-like [Megalobrama amblycephala]|uniref:caldesmon-like n=1 Tax=Megalobrama amblycephala TaxID=75352 RepID=UPI002013CE09|nr:caldesmon-like [Megalobrama amblycephala]